MTESFKYPIKDWAEIKDDYKNGSLIIGTGTGTKKLEAIKSSPYLSTIYFEVLPELIGKSSTLVIYGWGVGEQENHLIDQIFKNKTRGKVAISVFGNDQDYCYRVQRKINEINSKVEIEFFNSQSSDCWNNP